MLGNGGCTPARDMRADYRYLFALLSVVAAPVRRPLRAAVPAAALAVLAATCSVLSPPAPEPVGERTGPVTALGARAQLVAQHWSAVEALYAREVAPLERTLLSYRDDPRLARQVAVSLVREGRKTGLEPRLLLALLLVENPWLDPSARSPVGAVGLMQVMPLHAGQWPGCEPRLEDIAANICHGAAIFADYLERAGGDVERALLRYNGCVNGTNTPNCHAYPEWVFQRAGRASVLAWLKDDEPRKRTEGPI